MLKKYHLLQYMDRIPINHPILDNHGVFYPRALSHALTFEITLPPSSNIVVTSDTTKPYSYSLANLELEYAIISSDYLASEARSAYQVGKCFYYENVLLHKTFTISKLNDGVINEHVNIPEDGQLAAFFVYLQKHAQQVQEIVKNSLILI